MTDGFESDKLCDMIKVSKALWDEIKILQEIFAESADEGEVLSKSEALRRLMEDYDEPDSVAYSFRKELRKLSIDLGIVKTYTKKDLINIYISRGKKYDFKKGDLFYSWETWEPLEKLIDKDYEISI